VTDARPTRKPRIQSAHRASPDRAFAPLRSQTDCHPIGGPEREKGWVLGDGRKKEKERDKLKNRKCRSNFKKESDSNFDRNVKTRMHDCRTDTYTMWQIDEKKAEKKS